MAGNKLNKYDRGSAFQRRFNERYKESVFEKLPKRPFFNFLEILITRIGRLILLNLMYLVFFAPFIGVLVLVLTAYNEYNLLKMSLFTLLYLVLAVFYGPATAAFTYILRKTIADETISLVNDFMEQVKKNFKQGAFMGLFDAIVIFGVSVYIEFIFALFASGSSITVPYAILLGLLCLVVVIYFTMRYFIYMMMVTIDLKISQMMRNALAFVFIGAPTNLLVATIFAGLLVATIYFIPYSVFAILLIGLSFAGLMMNFNAYGKVKTHLMDPVLDPNAVDDSEKIFSDQPLVPGKTDSAAEIPAVSSSENKPNSDIEPSK